MGRVCNEFGSTVCYIDNENLLVGDMIHGREEGFGLYKIIKRDIFTSKIDKYDESRKVDFVKYTVEEVK